MNKENTSALTVNREHKSTVFSMIYRDKGKLLELYNAMNHTDYTDPEMLQIVTLENAIYMAMENDLAFIVDLHLYLYEHQSTYNPNMPLRDLFYVANEYQRLVRNESIYASRLIKLPAPHFVVFYNGKDKRPEKEILKLSDAYLTEELYPDLELKVTVLNINAGNNRELKENCRTLREYMQYVECVRRYTDELGMRLNEAVESAVNECINKGILKDFLLENKAEAMTMSIFEYNEAEEKEKMRRAEYAGGYEDGVADGYADGVARGIKDGMQQGLQQGGQKMLTLIEKMSEDGLTEQIPRLSKDADFLQEMLEKYMV